MTSQQIIVPHDTTRGALVAVRRMLVHASIAGLKAQGLYERYLSAVEADALHQINELIGPGWMPIDLALAHYQACDRLELSDEEIFASGARSGDTVGDALLLANARRSTAAGAVAEVLKAFSRMGRRIYDGGSTQYVALGARGLLVEYRGNPLYSIPYYRAAHRGFMNKTFSDVGLEVADFKFSAYSSQEALITVRITWK